MSTANLEPNGEHTSFLSLSDLKEVHTKLLKGFKDGETEVLDEIDSFIRRASAAGAVLDSDSDRHSSQSILDYWMTVLYRAKRTPPDATLAEFNPALSPKLADDLCPYRGLNAFQEEDKEIYYGRQRLVEFLLEKTKRTRLLFVVGSSGSGKSSLVLAGLLPALKANKIEGSDRWQYFPPILPGRNPLKNLASAIRKENQPAEWLPQQIEAFKKDPEHLLKTLKRFSPEPAVIIVDQFEEVFTLCTEDAARDAFINNLLAVVQAQGPRHIVVLTLRADFETYLAQNQKLMSLFEEGQVRVTPLTPSDLHAAIEEPAKRIGLKFEEGVVDALVKDILGEPEGLPLLQFTLLQLWKTREDGRSRITLKQYKKLGGARRALALTADQLYRTLNNADQITFKRIMLRLALPSGNLEVTRNPVTRSTLYFEDPRRVNDVLDQLRRAGLVRVTKGDTEENDKIEVAHEALVRHWPTLVDWIEKERVTMRQRRRLTSAAEQWREHGRDEGGLLGGSLLTEALQYDDLNELEKEFVAASQAAIERIELEKGIARQREEKLKQEAMLALEQKAEQTAKNATRMRQFVILLIPLTFILLAATAAAFTQSWRASASERVATEKGEAATLALKEAEAQRANATAQKNLAEQRRQELEDSGKALEKALTQAVDAKKKAEIESLRAREQAKLAATRLVEANVAKQRAIDEKRRADEYAADLKIYSDEKEKQLKLRQRRDEFTEISKKSDGLLKMGKPDEAIAGYQQLLKDYADISELEGREDILSKLSNAYFSVGDRLKRRGEPDNANRYYQMGVDRYEQAEKLIKDKVKAAQVKELMPARLKLAQFYRDNRRPLQAELEYWEAFKQQEATLSALEYSNFENLVEVVREFFVSQKDPDGLERLYQRVIDAKLKLYPDKNDREIYDAYNALAGLYLEQKRDEEAEMPYLDALAVAEGAIRKDPSIENDVLPYVFESQVNLGDLYVKLEKYSEAADFYEKALTTQQRVKGTDKRKLADTYIKFAEVRRIQGQYDSALELYEKAIVATSDGHGKGAKAIVPILNDAGEIYQSKSEYKKAEEYYKRALAIFGSGNSQGAGADATEIARTLLNLAGINHIYGKQNTVESEAAKSFEQSDQFLNRALSIYPKALDAAEERRNSLFRDKSAALNIEELYRGALERMLKRIKEGDKSQIRTAEVLFQKLARIYTSNAQGDKLADIYEQTLGLLEGINSQTLYQSLWRAYDQKGHSLESSGKFTAAETMFKKALEIGEGPLAKDPTRIQYSIIDLTELYIKQGNLAAAETLYLRGKTHLEKIGQGESSRMVELLKRYAKFLRTGKRPADADKIDEEIKRLTSRVQK